MLSKASLFFFLLLTSSVAADSQESPTPEAFTTARSVRITFLPPPLDGRSPRIYDAKGNSSGAPARG